MEPLEDLTLNFQESERLLAKRDKNLFGKVPNRLVTNQILMTILKLCVHDPHGWTGTTEELIRENWRLNKKGTIFSPITVGLIIARQGMELEYYFGIEHTKAHENFGNIHTFRPNINFERFMRKLKKGTKKVKSK
jgi:hypothetical protein